MRNEEREVRVRPARPEDLEQAGENAARAFSLLRELLTSENRTALEATIRHTTVRETLGCLLIAEQNGELVGSVRYTGPGHGGHTIYPNDFAYIRAVAVSPDHLRCGIGRKLTEACIEAAEKDKAEAVGLHVATANHAAVALYRQLGFRFYRDIPDYFGIPYQALFLRFSAR